jgi:hypothetical protein
MVKQMIKGLTMLVLLATLSFVTAVVSANGQSSRQVANIPFDFVVGDKELPAGKYGVESVNPTRETLKITGAKTMFRLSSTINHSQPAKTGKMVFHRYGNQYFLAEVWAAGETQGRQLLKSSREKAIEQEWAASRTRTEEKSDNVQIVLARP